MDESNIIAREAVPYNGILPKIYSSEYSGNKYWKLLYEDVVQNTYLIIEDIANSKEELIYKWNVFVLSKHVELN